MLKIGMIGCGGISKSHVGGWNEVDKDKACVVATADIVEESARERAEQLGADDVYTDYEKMLAREDIDAVDICLPHYLHCEATVKAADRGKHILCEKPMARTLEEGQQMLEAARQNNVLLLIGHNCRFMPQYAKFKELVDSGVVGTPFLLRVIYAFYAGLRDFHLKKDLIGGGTLISTGTHPLDLMRWFGGEVKRVSCFHNSLIRGAEGEDTAAVLLEFENRMVGTLISSWATRPGANAFSFYGENGMLTTEGGVKFIDAKGEATDYDVEEGNAFAGEMNHFADCLLGKAQPIIGGEEGYQALELAIAAYHSAEEGRAIEIASLRE